MHKVDVPGNPRQAATVGRRRAAELQRQDRIFNARQRTRGVDRMVLDQQVQERKAREERDRLRNEAFDSESLRHNRAALLLEAQQQEKERQLNKELNDYRARHQKPEDRRDFDLYDPDRLKKDQLAQVSQDNPQFGPAGMQRFDGEDPGLQNRRRHQQQQARQSLTAQWQEKKQANRSQRLADDLYHKKQMELDQRAVELSKMEEDCRRALDVATLNYNLALAAEQAAVREAQKRKEEEERLAEVGAHVHGDILMENPGMAATACGLHRVLTDRWKGMSRQQVEEIRQQQRLQAEERKRQKQQEAQLEAEWDQQQLADGLAALAMQRLEEGEARNRRQQLDLYNQWLCQEQQAHQKYLDNEVYSNQPSAEYFLQFNTTSR